MEVTEYAKDLYILDDGQVREFLIIGRNEAILIDTGFPETKIINEVQKLTSFPLKVKWLLHRRGSDRIVL